MGKRIEDLRKLDELDQLIERQVEALDPNQHWYQFVGVIEALLASGEYDWAFGTLGGIRDTVLKTRRVSEAQQRAVGNIEASKRDGRDDGWRARRYEGRR